MDGDYPPTKRARLESRTVAPKVADDHPEANPAQIERGIVRGGFEAVGTTQMVSGSEDWLHEPRAAVQLREALAWAQTNPPTDRKADAVLEKLRGKG
ncbi:MAG: hypothetical protein Q8O52_03440 [Sulfuritalea sp.]|nr:hypothetical protein [Sulfuritalea sp.]